ncbi:MAG TPA: DUF6702 family protein [Cyclobacteriaceae bacterium]|nr:DUF6702 family protein [Cyclobacteriaceae bacterium]
MISVIFGFLLSFHPIHLSITEIDYNEKSKALQLTSRIFIDDLELSIRNKIRDEELDLLEPGKGRTTDELVKAYLAEVVKVKVDKKFTKMNYLGHEIEGPAMICYIEIENVKKFSTIEVTNKVILETHDDQSNLVNVNYKDKVKSLRLTNDEPTGSVTFQAK